MCWTVQVLHILYSHLGEGSFMSKLRNMWDNRLIESREPEYRPALSIWTIEDDRHDVVYSKRVVNYTRPMNDVTVFQNEN